MSDQQTLVIELPDEANQLLAENGVDLIAALCESGINVTRSPSTPPFPAKTGGKEVALTIVAVGVAATLVAAGIAKILDALGRNRKVVVTELVLVPVVDGSGKPVHDAAGQPVMFWAEKTRLIDAKQTTQDKGILALEAGPKLLKFSLKSRE